MRRVLAQTRKELTQFVRDWRTLLLALVLPLVLMILNGSAISLTVNNLPIIVQDAGFARIHKCLSRFSHVSSCALSSG
jgi:ABC-type Na+ efflux pump permease subunit